MRVQEITLGLAAILSVAQAAALPTESTDAAPVVVEEDDFGALEARIVGNEANALLCVTPTTSKCGLYVTYTNGARRETVQWQSGGLTACSVVLTRKHTNGAGFWANLNFFGSPGMNIGYDGTGRQIALGSATTVVRDQGFLNSRCQSVFGWGDVDASKSTQSFWGDLGTKLY